jgi:hypothetical protein
MRRILRAEKPFHLRLVVVQIGRQLGQDGSTPTFIFLLLRQHAADLPIQHKYVPSSFLSHRDPLTGSNCRLTRMSTEINCRDWQRKTMQIKNDVAESDALTIGKSASALGVHEFSLFSRIQAGDIIAARLWSGEMAIPISEFWNGCRSCPFIRWPFRQTNRKRFYLTHGWASSETLTADLNVKVNIRNRRDERPYYCGQGLPARTVRDSRRSSPVPPTHSGSCATTRL